MYPSDSLQVVDNFEFEWREEAVQSYETNGGNVVVGKVTIRLLYLLTINASERTLKCCKDFPHSYFKILEFTRIMQTMSLSHRKDVFI